MRHQALTFAMLFLIAVWPDSARTMDEPLVFACNYSVSLSIGDGEFVVTHQDRVRNSSYIPIDFHDHLLRLRVSSSTANTALVELVILEQADDSWREIYPRPLSFEVRLGSPAEFNYSDEILAIDVALIVSISSR